MYVNTLLFAFVVSYNCIGIDSGKKCPGGSFIFGDKKTKTYFEYRGEFYWLPRTDYTDTIKFMKAKIMRDCTPVNAARTLKALEKAFTQNIIPLYQARRICKIIDNHGRVDHHYEIHEEINKTDNELYGLFLHASSANAQTYRY